MSADRETSLSTSDNALLDGFVAALRGESDWLNTWRIAKLTSLLLGNRLEAGDASHYLIHYARRQGYDLPPFPLAGCGEMKQFLADEGVADMPSWYEKVGIAREVYPHLHEKTLVAIRRIDGKRRIMLFDGILYQEYATFLPLEESGFIRKAKPAEVEAVLLAAFDWLSA